MRKQEGVEDRLEDWLGCWEGWEEEEVVVVVVGKEAWRVRRLEGRGGEKGARGSEMRCCGVEKA